jgi:hypothetical protein
MAKRRTKQAIRQPIWADWADDQLLDLRLCDLKLKVEHSPWLMQRIERLNQELASRDIRFRPHCWLSSEWFSPEGIPGIAIPFYLAHARLKRLEKKQMMEVEGGTDDWCMRILRHEAGHAIDFAYRLHFRKQWREVFGHYSQKYPDTYQPQPYSRRFVIHLERWYAQAHPAEDFAETFAVWLTPRSNWRQAYHGWPAMRKLQYVDDLMNELAGTRPRVTHRHVVEPLHHIRRTLRQHYRQKRLRYGEWPDFYDADLRRLFSDEPKYARRELASSFLARVREEVRPLVASWTGIYQYVIDQVLQDMIGRCDELQLRLAVTPTQARTEVLVMLTVQTMNYLHEGHHRIAL